MVSEPKYHKINQKFDILKEKESNLVKKGVYKKNQREKQKRENNLVCCLALRCTSCVYYSSHRWRHKTPEVFVR